MKKIVIVFMVFLVLVPSFAYAKKADREIDEVSASMAKAQRKDLLRTVATLENWESVTTLCAKIINKVWVGIAHFHNMIFGVNVGDTSDPDGLNPAEVSPRFLEGRFSGYEADNVFSWFLSIFIVLECMYMAFKIFTSQGSLQNVQILSFFIRIVLILIVWAFIPYMAPFFVNLAFSAAEKLTGTEYGVMSPAMALINPPSVWGGLTAAGVGFTGGSLLSITFMGVGFVGSGLSWLATACFGLAFGGTLLSFIICLQFLIRILDLYITNIILIIVLPAAAFTGFGDGYNSVKLQKILAYYFYNFLEIFIGAAVILFIQNIEINSLLGDSRLKNLAILCLFKPVALTVLMPATSKILTAILQGAVSDNNEDVQKGIFSSTRTVLTGGAIGMALRKTSQEEGEALRRKFPDAVENLKNSLHKKKPKV